MEEARWYMFGKGYWRVCIIFSLRSVSKSSYLGSIAIHMKFASLTKSNKSQIMAELHSALGQYLKQLYSMSFHSHIACSKFDSWNPSSDVKPGQPEYYQKQVYQHGTRCWNGPERNVIVSLHISLLFVSKHC